MSEYHIRCDEPCLPHWPNGSWSVYRINGDEIADRVIRAEIVKPDDGPAFYKGEVIARHSWCGYLGMTETFDGVRQMIETDQAEQANTMRRRVMSGFR